MAQQQAPPAALAPIAIVVDEVQINSDAMLVLAPGAQHVRDHTSFLNWATVYNGAAAVASYTLGQSDAKGAFLPRCQFSGDQQTGTLLDGNHVLSVFFNGAFWSRLLTALDAANLFATSMTKIGVLHLNGQSGSLEDRAHGHLSSFCTMWAQFGICLLPGGGRGAVRSWLALTLHSRPISVASRLGKASLLRRLDG